ncbi:MAG: cytidine deaminase [Rhodothermales bacterium]|nr:cytidine deaminase [Rhodothermales bacterium]
MPNTHADLLQRTTDYIARSRSTYSGDAQAATVLLSDGAWVPGVRVETASFSLAIDAAVNAISTSVAAGRYDIVAVALSHPATTAQASYLTQLGIVPLRQLNEQVFILRNDSPLPALTTELNPAIRIPESDSARIDFARIDFARIDAARRIAANAFIPESAFPVGCIAVLRDGTAIPGVNVENVDWNRIICAERNAVGTIASYGLAPASKLYLSCPLDPQGSPCGACRQVLAELAPGSTILMDRGPEPPHTTTPEALLPGSFTGTALLRRHDSESDPHQNG